MMQSYISGARAMDVEFFGILTRHEDMIEEIVKVLLEKETLDEKEVDEIIERVKQERNQNPA